MSVRQLGGLLGALGGVVWIARWLLSPAVGAADLMRWAGLGLVLLGLVCIGLTLVKGQARWLDLVVGVAAPALFWAVYELVRGTGPGLLVHAAIGLLCVVVGGVLLVRGGHRGVDDDDEYEEYDRQLS